MKNTTTTKKELTDSQLRKLENLKTTVYKVFDDIARGTDVKAQLGLKQAFNDNTQEEFFEKCVKPLVHQLAVKVRLETNDSELDQIIINFAE